MSPAAERPRCEVPGCQADAGGDQADARLCREHQRTLRGRLAEIPGILADLAITISRQDHMVEHSGLAAEKPLAYNEHAALADSRMRVALAALARVAAGHWTDDRDPLAAAVRDGAAELSRWCIRNRYTATAADGIGELLAALDTTVSRARAATDRPAVRTRFYVGPCPETQGEDAEHPGWPCPGEVWATMPDDERDPAWLRCLTCHHRWGTLEWYRVGGRIRRRMRELARERAAERGLPFEA